MSRRMRWLREPLLHFIVAGALLIGLFRWTEPPSRDLILIPEGVVREVLRAHTARTGTAPSERERRSIMDRVVDDEVLYREAVALGLDQGDLIVRRRLIQKMLFLTEDVEPVPEPTDEELQAYFADRVAEYTTPARVSFEHVYASSDRHPEGAAQAAQRWRDSIAAGADPATLGDPFLRGRQFRLRTRPDVARTFGAHFAARLAEIAAESWSQPVQSSYGWHLVRVTERTPARPPALEQVRDAVVRDWKKQKRQQANEAALARLRRKYEVTIEWPQPATESAGGETR